jgi:hypothetical protein
MSLPYLSWVLVLLLCFAIVACREAFSEQQASGFSESSSKPQRSTVHLGKPSPDLGSVADGVYRNSAFGFSYKIPVGWVERTADMSPESHSGEPGKALVLLAIFERPPEAAGDTVNSAVMLAAESASSNPGLKTAADYFEPLTELATSKGFKIVNEPYEFPAGTRSLVRGDFSKELGKLTMYQSSLTMLLRGYALSFTFIAGSEDEVEELIESLSFAGTKPASPAKSRHPQ